MGVAHFALGAALTTLVVAASRPETRYPRTIVAVGGGWAMVPDAYKVLPLPLPVAEEHLAAFHASPLADVFWLHRTLDRLDPTNSGRVAAALLACFVAATLLSEWRSGRSGLASGREATPVESD
ncbi:hypothetical protein [Salinilacihabitans rarus]|uniref:hypothetical protein n=1 Tax=Salinilacihabitans rarus TaxID=2961596 RepID=UPI0020C8BE1F|nr:hypothetical protein [Salinilacihabitans rarus]